MADYRRGLMDMTPEERQKVAPGFVPKTDVSKPLSVQGAEVAIEATPVGTAFAVNDIYEELKKEQPDYVKVGLMAAGEAVGMIPGVGDVAQSMIRKGADNVVDVSSNIPKVSRTAEPITPEYVKGLTQPAEVDTLQALNLTEADVDAWKVTNYAKDKYRIPPNADVADAAKQLREDPNFTSEQFREISNRLQPIKPIEEMPKMPTKEEVVYSIASQGSAKKTAKGVIGVNKTIKDGTPISSRLDIPAYNNSDTWVVSLHDGTVKNGDTVGYAQTAVLDNVNFTTNPLAASSIAAGNAKTTIARMQGEWKNADPDSVYSNAEELLKSVISGENTEWVQVGMNPYRASYFYDKADGMPVVSAEQVIQVGPLVLAKKAKKTTPDDPMFEFTNKVTGVTKNFDEGGMAMDEQTEAVFKSSRAKQVDPVSGNEVPTGSLPEEVRDDIPAQLSEGEYVVPADVVRYYGVKFFEDLRGQAKEGWSDMEENGRIGGDPIGPEGMEMVEPEDDLPFDVSELEVREYNEGGMVGQPISNTGLEAIFSNPTSNIEQKQYVGPNGEIMMLTFINGEPDAVAQYYIDEGYKPATESTQETETPTTTDPTASANEVLPTSQDDQQDYNAFQNEKEQVEERAPKFANKSVDELIAYGDQLVGGTLGKAAMGVTALNPMLGSLASVARRAEIFNVAKGLKEKYEQASSDEERKKIDDAFQNITSRGKEKGGGVLGGGGLLGGGGVLYDVNNDGKVDFGDTWLGDLLGFDGEAGIQGPSQKDSWNGARRVGGTGTKSITSLAEFYKTKPGVKLGTGPRLTSGATTSPTTTQTRTSSPRPKLRPDSGGSNDNGPSHSEIMASHNAMREARAASANKALSNNSTSSVIAKSKDKAATSAEASKVKEKLENMSKGAAGGFHKGGLMVKKT